MVLEFSDWLVIILFTVMTMATGLFFRGRSGRSMQDYFLGGRKLSW